MLMETKKIQKNNNIFRLLMLSILILTFILSLPISSAALPVSSYCQLSIQSMQLEVTHLNELISIMNQYQDDPQIQAQQIAIKQTEYNQILTSLYASFGTTGNEYVTYLGKHDQEVTVYLEANPDIKQQMDGLTSQIDTLLAQYESLKGYEGEPPEKPPLP